MKGWRYRSFAVGGVALLSGSAVLLINNGTVQALASTLPVVSQLPVEPPGTAEFTWEVLTTVAVFIAAFLPLYRPRPRRTIDTLSLAAKRVVLGLLMLTAIGYFDYTYRIPRLSLLMLTPLLLGGLPAWFVWIGQRPTGRPDRSLIVGDNPRTIEEVIRQLDLPVVGYLCPTSPFRIATDTPTEAIPDGGTTLAGVERLGGLSRIEDVLVSHNIDTVVLAFEHPDRAEFFGALDACYEHGVAAKVHPEHTDSVLISGESTDRLVDIELEPWDIQDYVMKRGFDIIFSVCGLLVLSPVIIGIAAAIKLDDGGSILYTQERTAIFGETFDVYKFRSMMPAGESATPIDDADNDRITDVGHFLRRTHLDEIPQLWSVLVGDMSVVGPRAVWTAEESLLEAETQSWRQRWFVKPGLTGLAQVNGVTSTNPTEKLRLDLQYVRQQSFRFDMKLVAQQVWMVLEDVLRTLKEKEESQ
ncbi:sugar transferase [Haloplanus aerogenes]|nr:lipopolysaccharide/colanic/teichoic acid biosynthesis glycosyltransferase [Haloplanus aerogenes]